MTDPIDADSVRYRLNKSRAIRLATVMNKIDREQKSDAIDAALRTFTAVYGDDVSDGVANELLATAVERGSLTAPEIAQILADHDVKVNSDPFVFETNPDQLQRLD